MIVVISIVIAVLAVLYTSSGNAILVHVSDYVPALSNLISKVESPTVKQAAIITRPPVYFFSHGGVRIWPVYEHEAATTLADISM